MPNVEVPGSTFLHKWRTEKNRTLLDRSRHYLRGIHPVSLVLFVSPTFCSMPDPIT